MSNVAFLSMASVLDKLDIYDMEKPEIKAEIKAYEAGFGLVLNEIENLLCDAFIDTASLESLEKREAIFRSVLSDTTLAEKRELLMERYIPRGAKVADMNSRLLACGISGNIVENHLGGIYINVSELIGVSQKQALLELENFLPANLVMYIDFEGSTWGYLDDEDETFGTIDANDLTWSEFEEQ